jgi:DNA-binding transcriptional MerR regulator
MLLHEHPVTAVLTTRQVTRITGTSARMLAHWDKTGLVSPSVKRAAGRGSLRQYSFSDTIVIGMIKQLRDGACPLQKIRAAVKRLRSERAEARSSESISQLTLVNDGKRVLLLNDRQQLLDVVTRQTVWTVPIGPMILEVRRLVEAMALEWNERLQIADRHYRLTISRAAGATEFVVRCKEIAGLMCKSVSATSALVDARQSIKVIDREMRRTTISRMKTGARKGIA